MALLKNEGAKTPPGLLTRFWISDERPGDMADVWATLSVESV